MAEFNAMEEEYEGDMDIDDVPSAVYSSDCKHFTRELLSTISSLKDIDRDNPEYYDIAYGIQDIINRFGEHNCPMDIIFEESTDFPNVDVRLKNISPYRDCVSKEFVKEVRRLRQYGGIPRYDLLKKDIMESAHQNCEEKSGHPAVPTLFVGDYRIRFPRRN